MSSSFKIKVVAVGHRSVKNIFFQNCNQISRYFSESSLMTVGVDIKVGRYSDEDDLTMSIWDLSRRQRFRAFFNTFFRGAAAYLIFHEMSKDTSYREIEDWINNIRTFTVNIPIFLIVYNPNLDIKMSFEDINRLVEENQIERFYLLSIHKKNRSTTIFNSISQRLLEYIGTESTFIKVSNELSLEERKLYMKFISYFLKCPICGKKNHLSNLHQIYFPTNLIQKQYKERLLNLVEHSENHTKPYMKRIKFGIPCCYCHNKVFS